MLDKIISGGQTGVDRGALDAALDAGFPCGGWCPRGRKAEDGRIDDRYPLTETPSASYGARTRRNVEDSDGTLILSPFALSGGTLLTARHANGIGRPLLEIRLDRLDADAALETICGWIGTLPGGRMNVAGPRESGAPGIQETCRSLIGRVIARTSRS
jgi:hypothetical protein